ncbi:MAG: DNA polymerase III subunit gamma/tau [Christensenellaceae bacterium]|jgi:DNA polymerase-3 subunit gamma/tau|nr:DNA polymerase III subunit gamma/tau [Christensenellaceae bacterium]
MILSLKLLKLSNSYVILLYMSEISLYRKYRPKTWEGVVGQDHIVKTLINQISGNKINHAYLFTGTRGTGKTSTAKIFSRAINCEHPNNGSPCGKCSVCLNLSSQSNISVIEMDAASNNGVDEIREIKDSVLYPPAVGKYKVYIVDEVHMLTTAAFNAFLKTLEEPPSYVVFILATTEVHKLPQTIISRCMRFDFRLVPQLTLSNHLKSIFKQEKYDCDKESLDLISMHAAGSVRDMLSLADMCMSYAPNGLKVADATSVLGVSDFSVLYNLAESILIGNFNKVLELSKMLVSNGKSISISARDLTSFFNEIVTVKNVPSYKGNFTKNDLNKIKDLIQNKDIDNFRLSRAIDIFSSLETRLRYSSQPHILFEAALIKATDMTIEHTPDGMNSTIKQLNSKVTDLENKLDNFKINPSMLSTENITNSIVNNNDTKSTKVVNSELPFQVETPSSNNPSIIDDMFMDVDDPTNPFDDATDLSATEHDPVKTVNPDLQSSISTAMPSITMPQNSTIDFINKFFDMLLQKAEDPVIWEGDKGLMDKPCDNLLWLLNLIFTNYGDTNEAIKIILYRGLILHYKLLHNIGWVNLVFNNPPPSVQLENDKTLVITWESVVNLTKDDRKKIDKFIEAFNIKCGTKYKAKLDIPESGNNIN